MNNEWMTNAYRAGSPGRTVLLGEDEHGDLWVGTDGPLGWERYNPHNPLHLLAYWRSKRRNVLVWLERTTDGD